LWLILGDDADPCLRWAADGLVGRGLAPVKLLTAARLGPGLRWEHRVGVTGGTVEVTLGDGELIRSSHLRGVLNRLGAPPGWPLLDRVHVQDRDYVRQELAAFFLSWLASLPQPMLNRPTPQGLAGAWRHPAEWVLLAAKAGLRTTPYRASNRARPDAAAGRAQRLGVRTGAAATKVLVIGGQAVGTAPPAILSACRRLGVLSGTALLGVELDDGAAGPWTFAGATPRPDLRDGGEPALDALAEALQASGGQL
jgi:hypothetical protein